jgi:hypothetical protein
MGTVYRIYCPTIENSLVYIGSTKQTLNQRYTDHKKYYKRFKNGAHKRWCSSYKVFDAYGIEYCIIEAIEYVEDVDSLVSRERYHFDNTTNKVNQIRMSLTEEDYTEYHKQYRETNKAAILEQNRQYYEENKEAITERTKQYYQDNKENYNEYHKQYREANKQALAEKNKKYYEENKKAIAEQRKKKYQAKKAALNNNVSL